jgi:NAD(P)-dependent dehydrogenase (short-subunit alcohol dehydrogenase family)
VTSDYIAEFRAPLRKDARPRLPTVEPPIRQVSLSRAQDGSRKAEVAARATSSASGRRGFHPRARGERGSTITLFADRAPGPDGEVYHASKAAVRSLSTSLQKGQAANNIRVINVVPGFVKTSIHVEMGISFEAYCAQLGNPEFISAEELADIILFCWKLPQRICVRDIVVMPTTSSFA